jgi:hemerythrin-like domain-containing protein
MKRDPRLRGLSSEHHQALVLARELGSGDALLAELQARFARELEPHFRIEEEVLLPALRAIGEHELVARTEREHAALRQLVDRGGLAAFAETLIEHVRFEERELFPCCEARLPGEVLAEVARRSPPP